MKWRKVAAISGSLLLSAFPAFAGSTPGPGGTQAPVLQSDDRVGRIPGAGREVPEGYTPNPARLQALSVIKDRYARKVLEGNPTGVMTAEDFNLLFPLGAPEGVEVLRQEVNGVAMVQVVFPKREKHPAGGWTGNAGHRGQAQ